MAAAVPAAYAGESESETEGTNVELTAEENGSAEVTEEASGTSNQASFGENTIDLSDDGIKLNGKEVGTDEKDDVYTSNDIIYYQDKDTYDSGNTYGEGTDDDKHTAKEAAANTVVNITAAGTYRISGKLSAGQIAIDLGDDAKTDPNAVVTLILDGADITCDVAPAVIFYNVYECDTKWVAYDSSDDDSTEYEASATVDTSAAGANVIIADGTTNNITGSHVAKIYKDNADQKKKYKFDGAFYSKMSMNVTGESKGTGVLNINADNEGLDTELHLTINGGIINITSQDDGINTNEDGVSVTAINGGSLHIVAGLGSEGDGIDSNGYLVINGGTVIASGKPQSDSGLDSDCGSYVNGGYVVATGSTMDWAESDSNQVTMNLQFSSMQDSTEALIVTDTDGKVVFAYDPDKDETAGSNSRGYQGAVVSCPEFAVNDTYYVYVGGDVTGTETNGLYDADTVTGFTGATRQEYTGSDVGGMGGMQPGGQEPPQNADGTTTPPEKPDGTDGQQPDGQEPPQNADGTTTPPEKPDGTNGQQPDGQEPPQNADGTTTPPELPDGAKPGEGPNGNGGNTAAAASVTFKMTDKVNAFSGVCDEGTTAAANKETTEDTDSQVGKFTDVHTSDWFAEGVTYVTEKNYFNGTSETTFAPNSNMTRSMLWTVLARMNDQDTTGGTTWYSKAQSWAKENGVSDGTNPDKAVTREQIVTMLWRNAGSPEVDQDSTDESSTDSKDTTVKTLDSFSDADSISDYAVTAMKWAVQKGIINGMSDDTIAPTKTATRAQVAAMIKRCASAE